jgi:Leucine-rich repeat (LRR) protein
MQKHLSLASLLFGLLLLVAFSGPNAHAQSDQCPRIYREGETIRTDSAQSYQWYRNGEPIPGATQQTYTPTGRSANYAVQVGGKASTPFAFELGLVNLIGQAFDEHLRPVANARITVGNQTTQSDAQGKFQFAGLSNEPTILLSGEKAGHWTSQRRIMPTGRETHVQLMLRSQPFEHELSAERGGTISRGPFFLTLQPNGVLDANNQRYTGIVKIALNGGRPDDPNFGWMMPGGDFMAQDAQGRERILYSYGFLSAHLQTPSGQPLKLDPNIGAQLRFVMPHTMVASAPDSLPLWHFDEVASIWKEEGIARREGAAYVGTVRHFSSWNCDWPGPWCQLTGKTVDCKGRPISGSPLRLGQQIINSDNNGLYSGRVPATLRFDIQAMNGVSKITVGPFEEGSENEVEDLKDGSSIYGYGVIDTSNWLKVHSYGARGEALHSANNGVNYQTRNTFVTHMDSSYQVLVKDSVDCPTKVNYVRLGKRADCQVLDNEELTKATAFRSIEEAFASEEPVYKLDISSLDLSMFPEQIISYFPCIHELNLSYIPISRLTESISNLSQLQKLVLINNSLTTLPRSFGNLSQLTSLYLEYNQLTNLSESIGNLTQLQWLALDNNQLTSLPEAFGNLTQLVRLELNYNQLTSLPQSIGNLKQLQGLELNNNQLTSLPASTTDWTMLTFVKLNDNRLNSLPESIGNWTNLSYIEINDNQLKSLPESIGNLSQLQQIWLNNNQLTSLPASIKNWTNLKYLSLEGNRINSLPDSMINMINLNDFNLAKNQLSSVPDEIRNLTRLWRLKLDSNQLTSVPDFLGQLTNLNTLDLSFNQLTTLPDSMRDLINLRQLNLRGNPISPEERRRIRFLLPTNCIIYFE